MANSAYYGGRYTRRINNAHHAIVIIGFDALKEIVLTISLFHTFREIQDIKNLHPLWKHSLQSALVSKRLAWAFRYENTDEAYLVGLIHDIGKLIIQQHFLEKFNSIYGKHYNGPEILKAEEKLLGITHAVIGGGMAQHWDFPTTLCEAISHHHDGIFKLNHRLGAILYGANAYVSGEVGFSDLIPFFKRFGMFCSTQWREGDLIRVQEILQAEMQKGSFMWEISKNS
jgi:putative nucleotidyltransferase with HDIG domain